MKFSHFIPALLFAATFNVAQAQTQESLNLIPRPLSVELTAGHFELTAKTCIAYDAALKGQADYLADVFAASTGYDLTMKAGTAKPTVKKGCISLVIDTDAAPKAEGYQLDVTEKGVLIKAHDAAGAFYGIQTLLQMMPPAVMSRERQHNQVWTIPCATVSDAPSYPWRGMMLDVARYFYHKDFVKKYIDAMAAYKLNKLQFHLIDDSGWRLEIKKYPRLTQIGAWSGEGANRLGGFYTQEDIRELIEYAAVRGVEIIPEIEFPAHLLSAVVAYPWLSCTGRQHEVPGQHFISRDLICAGKESSMKFLFDVLDETMALFPSKYINIGGDEAVYTRWEQCPDCQALMKREGLSKASELQGYLTNVVADRMKQKGRTVIGWEEIVMRGKVNTPAVALIWHNPADSARVKADGHQSIITPCTHLYFDFPESDHPDEPQHATWCPPVSLEKAYNMPLTDYSTASSVLGVQGCYWSDQFIHGTKLQEINLLNENRSERYAEYFTFPRLLALSELGWTPAAGRSFCDFTERLKAHYARLDAKDITYRLPEPAVTVESAGGKGGYTFTLSPTLPGAEMRYTTDGTTPTPWSPIYTGPVTVSQKSDFRSINVLSPQRYSLSTFIRPDYSAWAKLGTFITDWKPLRVQTAPSLWKFDATGKISGNGEYELSFVQIGGKNALQLSNIEVWKRDERVAVCTPDQATTNAASPATFKFSIDSFEAGTPFSIRITSHGLNGNDTRGYVFIKKL